MRFPFSLFYAIIPVKNKEKSDYMHRFKNIAITGEKQAGKSTLARWLLEQLSSPSAGFQTVRYDVTAAGPLYALEELTTGERAPISHLTEAGIRGIPENFDGFGKDAVARAAASPDAVILLDEIGRFERCSECFLAAVAAALDSEKTVIAVLKKEELPHIAAIKGRPDTLVIDLDEVSRAQAKDILTQWLRKP